MYWYIPVHASTYCFILTGECVYLYIQLYAVTGKYMSVHTSSYQFILVPACTRSYWNILSTYQYIPVHTFPDLGSKKMQTGFEPVIFCILFASFPLSCKSTDTGYRMRNNGNVCVYINIVHNPACVPGAWCRIDGAGPAQPPPPAMTSTARIWIGISR
jgi:hypothetical protein